MGIADIDPKIRELRSLRGRGGLMAGRAMQCKHLMAALEISDPGELTMRIVAALRQMRQDHKTQALINAYAIDIDPREAGNLTQRREWFGLQHGGRNPETVEVWENDAIVELLTVLTSRPVDSLVARLNNADSYWVRTCSWVDDRGFLSSEVTEYYEIVNAVEGSGSWEPVHHFVEAEYKAFPAGAVFLGGSIYYQFEVPEGVTKEPISYSFEVDLTPDYSKSEKARAWAATGATLNQLRIAPREELVIDQPDAYITYKPVFSYRGQFAAIWFEYL